MKINQDPAWQAKLDVIASKKIGALISHSQIDKILCLAMPVFDPNAGPAAYRRLLNEYQLRRMSLLEQLKHDMLAVHKLYLRNSRSNGFVIVHPDQQVETAYNDCLRDVRKSFIKADFIVNNVRETAIGAEQRQKDSDTKAKLAVLKNIVLKQNTQ